MVHEEELLDVVLKNPLSLVYLSIVALTWCVACGSHIGDTVELELRAYRLQQFDLQSTPYGSRSWRVTYEAVTLDAATLRRCIVLDWRQLAGASAEKVFAFSVGAMLVVIPADLDLLSPKDRKLFAEMERDLHAIQSELAIYFSPSTPYLLAILEEIRQSSETSSSAAAQLVKSIAANTFQFSSLASVSTHLLTNPPLFNVIVSDSRHSTISLCQAKLASFDRSGTSATIAIIAHYDSWAPIPKLAVGADSNASGVATLLELLAIISRYYQSANSRPLKYNFVFVATAAGKFNYQGSRQWIDEYVEKHSDEKLELVVCLDSLARGDVLHMHASKMPNETTPAGRFFSKLQLASSSNRSVKIVVKKVNLGSDWLAWEHERFSMRRLPAITLSHMENHAEPSRSTVLDTVAQLDLDALYSNIQTIAEALLSYAFNLPSTHCADGSCSLLSPIGGIESARVDAWITRLTQSDRSATGPHANLVADLRAAFVQHSSSVNVEPVQLADVSLYGVLDDTLVAHRVKPAVFELLLATMVALYLAAFYFLALNIQPLVDAILVRLRTKAKTT